MHVAPIKLNEAREGPNPTAPPRNQRALYGRNGGLPNEFIHQAAGREVVEREPLVARQGCTEAPQAARIVRPFSICRHRRSDPER